MDPEDMEQGSSSSDTSSDSGSDSGVEMDDADMQQLMQLESDLKKNPYLYDLHLQYVALLRKCKLHARLRAARQSMHKLFPLNEQLWMDWIEDEMDATKTSADLDHIRQLYSAAVKDYLSVNLWSAYLQFLSHIHPDYSSKTAEGVAAFRQVAETAIQACGLHIPAGSTVWRDYRQYEAEVLAASSASSSDKAADKVRQLYQRQLQVPLEGNGKVMEEYTAWEAARKGQVPDNIKEGAAKAAAAVQMRAKYEAAVSADKPAGAVVLAAYMAYIKLEEEHGDPARVQVIFERAVAAFPVTAELWLQYLSYLEHKLKLPPLVAEVASRAVHNCPWVGPLWVRALRALERSRCTPEQHEQLYQRALAAGLQGPEDYLEVLLARADYLRHCCQAHTPGTHRDAPRASAAVDANGLPSSSGQELRAHFAAAVERMGSSFPEYLDRTFRLPGYWAQCEAHVLGDVGAGEAVWEQVLKGPLGRYCDAWCSYAAWQRNLRRLPEARRVYSRGYSRKLLEGGQLVLCYDWLRFEREEGSAEDLFLAHSKVDPIIEEASAAAAASNVQVLAVAQAAAQQAPKLSKSEIAAMRRANDPNFKKPHDKPGKKRPADDAEHAAPKRSRQADHAPSYPQPPAGPAPQQAAAPPTAAAAAAPAVDEAPYPAPAGRKGDAAAADQHMEDAAHHGDHHDGDEAATPTASGDAGRPKERFNDEHTVFIKGLGFDVLQPDLERLFAGIGNIKAIRMGTDRITGQPRGFAYVEFATEAAMQKAIELDGRTVNGRTLFIAKSAPPAAAGGGRGGGGRGPPFRGGPRGGGGFRGGARGVRLPHVPVSAGHGNMGHPRSHLVADEEHAPGVRLPALVPRTLAVGGDRGRGRGGGGGRARPGLGAEREGPQRQPKQHLEVAGEQGGAPPPPPAAAAAAPPGGGAPAPKSNEEFRKMFLAGGKL